MKQALRLLKGYDVFVRFYRVKRSYILCEVIGKRAVLVAFPLQNELYSNLTTFAHCLFDKRLFFCNVDDLGEAALVLFEDDFTSFKP